MPDPSPAPGWVWSGEPKRLGAEPEGAGMGVPAGPPPGTRDAALELASASSLATSLMPLALPSGEAPPASPPESMPSAPRGPELPPPVGPPPPLKSSPEARSSEPSLDSGKVGRSARQVQRMLGTSSLSQQAPPPVSSVSWNPSR
jgi:hypothetical protein